MNKIEIKDLTLSQSHEIIKFMLEMYVKHNNRSYDLTSLYGDFSDGRDAARFYARYYYDELMIVLWNTLHPENKIGQ
jgi:hypothetical protein